MFDTLRDNSRIIVYIVVVAFVVSGGFMGYGAYLNNQGGGGQAPNQSPSVIAEVNGMEISQQEYFSFLQQQAPQSNLSSSQIIPFRYNVLNALIERKLIMDQAEKLGVNVKVSESEVDKNYQNILDQNKMTDQELADALAEQGYTIGQLREDIKSNLEDSKTITKTIEQGIPEVTVSDQEIQELYNQRYPQSENESENPTAENNTAETEKPELAEVKENLETEIRNQKRNQAVNNWLKELKSKAEITINEPVLSAYHALENENYNQAVEEFKTFVEQEETDAIFYSYLAQAYEGQNNYDKAEETYKTAIKSFPENNELKFNYAQFLAEQEKNDKAIALLDEVAAGAEDDFMTYYQLFMLYSQLGAEEKAQSAIEEVQRISQNMQQNQENVEIDAKKTEKLQDKAAELDEDIEVETPVETETNN
ncbi:SurA N-terminal domain-containing protein [Halanaerobium congolense]|uniref:SurA N-terminal domain-containing protein n=1 Tax=Halanaerobium congolense TaxID=54121 RepID=UPI00086E3C77|nr:SurA N-terminal domain-containing protein [Halanaerobium congolense]OEG62333.1 MAG: SurA domain-containing protein [Halanaerobium sp. MDAL1]TDP11068.1 tetratricopeptide repeat protein [Halanaerobium congolense]SDG99024.1 Tetratricopeptide repeat-containing protein [Halanaerobium congolense]SDK48830.1 Tetratricopeptide repeat-containing protein [Halanaerobium congolense]SDM11304.1 Tetratricopeptide repeat-containing protein [Halanaerobium congolense]